MKKRILTMSDLTFWISAYVPMTAVRAILLGGDRLGCLDEAVGLEVDGEIVGIVTIAPEGEDFSGMPEIVAVYVRPELRGRGFATPLMEATVRHCVGGRRFPRVRVTVLSRRLAVVIRSMDRELQGFLEVTDHSDVTDMDSWADAEVAQRGGE